MIFFASCYDDFIDCSSWIEHVFDLSIQISCINYHPFILVFLHFFFPVILPNPCIKSVTSGENFTPYYIFFCLFFLLDHLSVFMLFYWNLCSLSSHGASWFVYILPSCYINQYVISININFHLKCEQIWSIFSHILLCSAAKFCVVKKTTIINYFYIQE